jgi:hypothetical protein
MLFISSVVSVNNDECFQCNETENDWMKRLQKNQVKFSDYDSHLDRSLTLRYFQN